MALPAIIQKVLPRPVKNFFFPASTIQSAIEITKDKGQIVKNLSGYILPVQLQRLRIDVLGWRGAISEAEAAYFPHRVKMQQMFNDVILWGHVEACWSRRKDLTLLRDYEFYNQAGEEVEDLGHLFNKPWFASFMSFALDGIGFGYSLISLGDIVNDGFPDISVIRRWNVSPDRTNVTAYMYAIGGINFLTDEEVAKWHVWAPTVNQIGNSNCGMGLFYNVALPSIYLRNNIGFNIDYAENFGQPVRVGTTSKTDEDERAEYARALASMGSEAWILKDPTDELELLESKSTGQGFKVYESIEARCEKAISKMILGHSDALDSVPGKLGAGTGEDNPVITAMLDKQTKDGRYIEAIINDQLLPKMRVLGFNIPEGVYFSFKNDDEKESYRKRQDASNKVTADIAQTMKNAGLKMDAKYFEERTGIPSEAIEEPTPEALPPSAGFSKNIQSKLRSFYGN